MERLGKEILKRKSEGRFPERVLQFGTGVLLRGLPDYFIEKANREGFFHGEVVVVKSTDSGSTDDFAQQDCLYTLYIKGIQQGEDVQEQWLISAISRVVSATSDWKSVLDLAKDPNIEIVISNTTEIGVVLDEQDDLSASPPRSFPGKLTAFLHERF